MHSNIFRKMIIFVLVLFLIVPFPVVDAASSQQVAGTAQVHLQEFDLVSETSGWILLNGQIFWTSDSGRAWDEIGPSVPLMATMQDAEFIDFNNGWLLWTTVNPDGSSSFTLAHTTNHGATWTSETLSLFESGEVSAYSEEAGMGWLDAQNGWIKVKQSSSSNFS